MPLPVDTEATFINDPTGSSTPLYDAAELRRADAALVAGAGHATDRMRVAGGIALHSTSALAVTVDGSDVVTIQPGAVVIPQNETNAGGAYRSALSAVTTGSLAARHATNPRIDLVVFRALDIDVVGAHPARTGRIEIIAGTPAGSPVAPSLPNLAVELARITVPASGGGPASVDSSKRTFAAALGAVMLVANFAGLPAAAAPWQMARALDTGSLYEWTGAAWRDVTTDKFTGGEGAALAGAAPPAGTRKITRQASVVLVTNASGDVTVGFPEVFPNGLVSVVVGGGDIAGNCGSVVCNGAYGLNAFGARAYTPAGAGINTLAVRFNYTAIGW